MTAAAAALLLVTSPGAHALFAALSAADRQHLRVADSSVLGYHAGVDAECGFGDAELDLMIEDALVRHELRPHADARSPEGPSLDVRVGCLAAGADGTRMFSIRAAFSLAQADGSDLLVNADYGTFGRGDAAFVEAAIGEAVGDAIADFRRANPESRAEAAI